MAVCAEYDALPDVGHACGHNIIAATAVGAGLALAAVADDLGLTVRVLGTPAEEGGGGKVLMLERGAFAGVHAAMMVHPWPTERLTGDLPRRRALRRALPRPRGPRLGRAVGGGQRAGRADHRPGGHRPAAPTAPAGRPGARRGHQELVRRQRHPGRGHGPLHGALAHGRRAGRPAAPGRRLLRGGGAGHRVHRSTTRSCRRSTRTWKPTPTCCRPTGSTPRRSVGTSRPTTTGRRCPRSRPTWPTCRWPSPPSTRSIGIETHGAVNHQREFAAACVTPSADAAVRDGAVALAWTAIDAATDPALRARLLGAVITEHALLEVIPGQEDAFLEAMDGRRRSSPPARASSRCGSSAAWNDPSCFLLLVEWERLEDHTEGFRGSAAYEEWRAALHHFYDPFPVVEHFEAVVTA